MPASAQSETWTTRRLLEWMTRRFRSLSLTSPRVVAEMLLAHVLGCERLRLYMEADRPATPEELTLLRDLVKRASEHEPVQYLTGTASFFARDFLVDDSTLIPQPCTEELVSQVIEWCSRRWPAAEGGDGTRHRSGEASAGAEPETAEGVSPADGGPRIVDIGTGTGCIAVTLALQLPSAQLIAIDISGEALDLARRNAERFGVENRIEFRQGSLLEPLGEEAEAFDVICSNPPYISDDEWQSGEVEESVKRSVPASATRGGRDGLDVIGPLIAGCSVFLRRPGLVAVEIGSKQGEAVLELVAQSRGLTGAEVINDLEGHPRLLVARKRDET